MKARNSTQGFTLMEAIVAIGIVFVGVIGVLILLTQSTRSIRAAENRMVAAHLAQEAIEVVVAIRNSNWVAGKNWLAGGLTDGARGIVNYNSSVVTVPPNSSFYCLDLTNNIYVHGTPPCNTNFSRHVEIDSFVDPDLGTTYIEVKAIVDWVDGGTTRTVTVVDELFNWQ